MLALRNYFISANKFTRVISWWNIVYNDRQTLGMTITAIDVRRITSRKAKALLFDILDLLPLSLEVLLPQTDFVISATHRENIAARAPATLHRTVSNSSC